MKKLCLILLCYIVVFSLCSCSNSTDNQNTKIEPITLTTDNVEDYVSFRGEFIDSEAQSILELKYVSESTIDFQAYSVKKGSFDNVEITIKANISEGGSLGSFRLKNTDDSSVIITFNMPSSGAYSSKYEIECDNYSGVLEGSCTFEVISVSGTFLPEN